MRRAAATWDAKGNLISEPRSGKSYTYSSENLLKTASGGVTLAYDPAMRLSQVTGAATTRFQHDGLDMVAEYDGAGALQRRFVFDPTTGRPVVWYEGAGTAASNRRYLAADERGSVIAVSDSAGNSLGLNRYDEYGKPQAGNLGRFQYTGQMWIAELGAYHFPFRDYLPHLGIFAQPDPIGLVDSPNLYAYVLNDPINLVDPLGLCGYVTSGSKGSVIITGCRQNPGGDPSRQPAGLGSGGSGERSERGGRGGGDRRRSQCTSPNDTINAARDVLEAATLGADVTTVGLLAGGVTAPLAGGTRVLGLGLDLALGAVNFYDALENGNWGSFSSWGAGFGARLVPGGKALQSGLIAARGSTGPLRNSLGQFRSSHLKNPAVKESGQVATQRYASAVVEVVACPK